MHAHHACKHGTQCCSSSCIISLGEEFTASDCQLHKPTASRISFHGLQEQHDCCDGHYLLVAAPDLPQGWCSYKYIMTTAAVVLFPQSVEAYVQ